MMGSRLAAGFVLAALAGCGMAGDAGSAPDAGIGGDAGATCTMSISFPDPSPEAPAPVTAYGDVATGGLSGAESYQWQVTFDGVEVPVTEHPDGTEIQFDATEPGVYTVSLGGSVGGRSCLPVVETINVTQPGASTTVYRLRFEPTPEQPAPIQERLITVPGGADEYSLGTLSLDGGATVEGVVTTPTDQPVPGYLRFIEEATPPATTEAFAGADGSYSARLAVGVYDVLVVPEDETRAPLRVADVTVSSSLDLVVPEGDRVTGQVLDGAGQPVVGARVSLRTGGVSSGAGYTGADGSFGLRARTGAATAVTVVPPDGSGLPRLELPVDAGLVADAAAPLAIRYAASLSSRTVQSQTVTSDGSTAAPGARVIWVLRPLAGAGTVTPEGGAALAADGRLRVAATADGTGQLPAVTLTEGVYDVVVEPAAGADDVARVLEVDLTGTNPSPDQLAQAEPVAVGGVVVGADAQPVGGVRVRAAPTGLLVGATQAGAMSASDSETGVFSVGLAPGGSYELVFTEPDGAHARVRRPVTVPTAGAVDLGEVAMPDAIRVTGRVSIPGAGGGAPGVHLVLLCYECSGLDAVQPVAEGLTSSDGGFVLHVPDTGAEAGGS